ncbi:hypothetical protein LSAT2_015216 [Lamellibrachia satsuma]|nr:hypothetical protein LSAT2_015216 [Lamellibrachia satsuma]
MYGYFRCDTCNHGWESSQVYCHRNTQTAAYKQGCSTCKTEYFPYRVERLRCPQCGETDCSCERDDRHIDKTKHHRADLCQKCKAGRPCQQAI